MSLHVTDKTCPLCGKPNNCKAGTNKKCWCFDVKIPQDLLNKVPKNKQPSCICYECIKQHLSKS